MMLTNYKYICYFFLLVLLGCQNESNKTIKVEEPTVKKEIAPIPSLLEKEDFKNLLAQQKGKIVLVNLWATWCKPCVYELPALEKLHQKYQNQDVKIIALSIEGKTKADTLVRPFWEHLNLTMDNYIISDNNPSALINTFDKTWLGVVPTSYIFDQNGEKVETITGTLPYEDFEKKIISYKKQAL